ncbi:hypothetical protein [Paraburkholderia sacchari]|uniref:hypothetical protein n=1 Tax=Paraburkholderia sacchari TaxID=159450 RepID=UPI001BCDAB88|nr:hypothetical protein [Paraburkholderia sacchari]
MNHTFVEAELRHLETVFRLQQVTRVLPLEWWLARIKQVSASAIIEDHVRRVKRLEEALRVIEREEALTR